MLDIHTARYIDMAQDASAVSLALRRFADGRPWKADHQTLRLVAGAFQSLAEKSISVTTEGGEFGSALCSPEGLALIPTEWKAQNPMRLGAELNRVLLLAEEPTNRPTVTNLAERLSALFQSLSEDAEHRLAHFERAMGAGADTDIGDE